MYQWSDSSALWEIEFGELNSERTTSAFTHLEVSLNGGDSKTTTALGLRLLGIVERARHLEASTSHQDGRLTLDPSTG